MAEYTDLLRQQACAAADEHAAEARALGGRLRAAGATPSSVVAGASAALTALTRGRRVRLRDAIAADGVLRPALLAAFDTEKVGAVELIEEGPRSEDRSAIAQPTDARSCWEGLLQALPDALFRLRRDGLLLGFKPAPAFVPYVPPEDFVGRNVQEVLPAAVAERIVTMVRTAVDNGTLEAIEYELAYPDGVRVFEARAARCAPDEVVAIVRDLTEHRRAEAALRASEERLRMVLDATADGVWEYHVPTDTAYFSPGWIRLLGLDPAEVEPRLRTWSQRVHPDDRPSALSALQAHLRGDTPAYRAEFRMRTAAGQWKWILARGRVVERDACNEAVRVVGTHTDIDAQKQTEAALRASEAQYRLIVEHQTDMVCRTDANGRLLFVSPSYCDTFGVAEDDLLGRPFMPLIHEEDRAAVAEGWSRTLVPPYTGEVVERALTRHGWRWQAWHNKAILDADGQVAGVVCVGRDVHEQKLAELALERYGQALEQRVAERTRELVEVNARLEAELAERREAQAALRRARDELEARVAARTAELLASEERWRSLVATAPDFIMLLNLDGTIHYLNRASPGMEVEDNLGTHLTLHAFPEFAPRINACLEQVARTGAFAEFEMAGLRPDLSTAWYSCRLGLFRQNDRVVGYTCIATDVTARKQAEFELERHREQLEERVRQRTAQLVTVNAQLQEELARRSRIEAELRESEARYRALFEGIPVPVYVVDPPTGRMLDANPAVTHVYGWERSEFLKLSLRDLEAPPRRPSPPDGTSAAPPVYHRRRDGTVFPVDVTPSRVQLGGNTVTIEAVRDISARVELEQVLRLQRDLSLELSNVSDLPEALERLLAAALAVEGVDCGGVYLADPGTEGLSLACHRNVSATFAAGVARLAPGTPEARHVGRGQPLYLPAGHPDIRPEHVRREGLRCVASIPVLADGRVVAALVVASRVADDWSSTARHMLEAIGAHIGIILSSVRARADLRASEQMFRTLAETVPAAIIIVQGERIRFANGMTAQIAGRPLDEVLRTSPWEFVHPEMRGAIRARALARQAGQSEPTQYELRVQRPDGADRWLDFSVARIELDGQPAALGVALDATARKAAAAKERQHLDQLAHVGRVSVVGELATGIAHDLAQPVSAILYYAKGALARLESRGWNPEQAQTVLERIAAQSERAAEIIRRLKDFVRRAEPRRTPQQLAELVAEAVRLAEPLSRAKRAQIDVCAVDGLPLVTVDPIQIEQVLINLLQNAMEAVEGLPPDERRVTVRIHAPTPADVRVSVTDRGPGVSPTIRPGLFTAFFTTKPDGLGVGLSMSRSIIEAHDGRLWLEDTPAGETTFTFALPTGPS